MEDGETRRLALGRHQYLRSIDTAVPWRDSNQTKHIELYPVVPRRIDISLGENLAASCVAPTIVERSPTRAQAQNTGVAKDLSNLGKCLEPTGITGTLRLRDAALYARPFAVAPIWYAVWSSDLSENLLKAIPEAAFVDLHALKHL